MEFAHAPVASVKWVGLLLTISGVSAQLLHLAPITERSVSESGSGQLITPGEHNITAYIEITFLISFDNYNYTQKQDELENEIICTISNFSHSNTHRIVLVPDEGESLGNFTVLKIYLVSANNEYDLLATEQVFYNISSEEMVFKEQLRMATGLEVISLRLVSDFVSTTAPLPKATTTSLTPALTPTQTPTPTRKVSTYIEITLMVNVQDYSSMKNVDDAIKSVVYNVSLNDRIVLMINEEESSDSTTVIDIYFVSLSNEYDPKATELAYYKISSMEMEFKGTLRAATGIEVINLRLVEDHAQDTSSSSSLFPFPLNGWTISIIALVCAIAVVGPILLVLVIVSPLFSQVFQSSL